MLARILKLLFQSRTSNMTLAITLCILLAACSDPPPNSTNELPVNDAIVPFEGPNFRFVLDSEFAAGASDFFVENANTFYPDALEQLNALNGLLPETVVITYRDCGVANAFYQPSDRTITLCSEFDNTQFNILLDLGIDYDDAFEQSDFVTAFVMDHEIGHALVDILNLPVAANRESTADAIATVLSVERSLGGTKRPYSLFGGLSVADQPTSYGAEHGNGQDRSGDIICWTVGGRTELLFDPGITDLVQPFVDSGRDCTAEYQDQLSAVQRWLPGFAQPSAMAVVPFAPSFTAGFNDLVMKRMSTQSLHGDAAEKIATNELRF